MTPVLRPRPKAMTETQRKVYRFIVDFTQEHGFQPTFREMCAGLGYHGNGVNSVVCHIRALDRKGWITVQGQSRAIVFHYLPDGTQFRGLTFKKEHDKPCSSPTP